MLITFSGLDGSGKTTQARHVCDLLASWGHANEFIHLIPWTWVNQIGEKLSRKQKKAQQPINNKKRPSKIQRFIQIGFMGLDLTRFRLLLFEAKRANKVIVCDRYFYDLGVQAHYVGVMPDWLIKVYWWFVPKPDYAFLLDVSPILAEKREGEHASEYYHDKQVLYQAESEHWPVIHVPAVSLESAKEIIVAQLQELEMGHKNI